MGHRGRGAAFVFSPHEKIENGNPKSESIPPLSGAHHTTHIYILSDKERYPLTHITQKSVNPIKESSSPLLALFSVLEEAWQKEIP